VNNFLNYLEKRSSNVPWTNVYGLARTSLALGTLLTFLFNDHTILFRPAIGVSTPPFCTSLNSFSLFCLWNDDLQLAQLIAIAILLVVISGWRPRITGILHWWVSFSFTSSATLLDGGDHITSIITLLLIPVCLTDCRISHWVSGEKSKLTLFDQVASLVAQSALVMISIQVSIIYLNASISKIFVTEWLNGTAIYYWWTHPTFGSSLWANWMVTPLLTSPFLLKFISWATILLELFLFTGLVMNRNHRTMMLFLGLGFHFWIIMFHGLFSFFFAMTGALILYLGPRFKHIQIFDKYNYLKVIQHGHLHYYRS